MTSMFSPASGAGLVTSINNTLVKGITLSAEIEAPVEIDTRAAKIDAYFASKDLPFAGHGKKLVEEADKRGIDWTLVAAIAMRESTGGKFACKSEAGKNNAFGWGSCKIGFESIDHSIEKMSEHLAGDNPKTARYYDGKDLKGILQTYNPPSVIPKYAEQVIAIMDDIKATEITESLTINTTDQIDHNS